MPIITLTSDWGTDFYPGLIRGLLLQKAPNAQVVDISHHVAPYSLPQAAWLVARSFRHFPEGTTHLIAVHNDRGNIRRHVAASYAGHYFVSMDNGLLGMICTEGTPEVVSIEKFTDQEAPSFPSLSVLGPASAHLAQGMSLEDLGPVLNDYLSYTPLLPTISRQGITGTVIYIDSFKNLITNITRQEFETTRQDRKFEIFVASHRHKIQKISKTYHDVPPGELVALFNASGYMEIAMNRGPIADLLNIATGTNILIKFAG